MVAPPCSPGRAAVQPLPLLPRQAPIVVHRLLRSVRGSEELQTTSIAGQRQAGAAVVAVVHHRHRRLSRAARLTADGDRVVGGDLAESLEAFRAAKGGLSANVLVATLKKLDYAYPYHQAIGFYLERAGYPEKYLQPLRDLGLDFDFYLTYHLGPTGYDSSWRLVHPEGM
jgi:hypothetical protein